jgi:hypothetical protein
MPKIQWTNLPAAIRQHLFDRLAERKITATDLEEDWPQSRNKSVAMCLGVSMRCQSVSGSV